MLLNVTAKTGIPPEAEAFSYWHKGDKPWR